MEHFSASVAERVKNVVEVLGRDAADYSELEVVHFAEHQGYNACALVLPDTVETLPVERARHFVVTVNPLVESDYLKMLQEKSPWPPALLPPGIEKTKKADLVVRRVNLEEFRVQVKRLHADPEVRKMFIQFGYLIPVPNRQAELVSLYRRRMRRLLQVREDIAWRVLRHEFGLAGERRVPHWRMALRDEAFKPDQSLLTEVLEVLIGERKANLPSVNASVARKIPNVEEFQEYVTSRVSTMRNLPE